MLRFDGRHRVAAADPYVIYVGMGEANFRGNVSHGNGVYRSSDSGKTWTHLGLSDTRNIGKVRIYAIVEAEDGAASALMTAARPGTG